MTRRRFDGLVNPTSLGVADLDQGFELLVLKASWEIQDTLECSYFGLLFQCQWAHDKIPPKYIHPRIYLHI